MENLTKEQIREAVQEAFSAGIGEGRYIDVTRVPLICQSIVGIDKKLEEMSKDMKESRDDISTLKGWRWMLAGGLAVVVFLFPFFMSLYNDKINTLSSHIDSNTSAIQQLNK